MSAVRDKILRFYKGSEGESIAIRCVDWAEQTVKTQKFRLTPFLSPYEQEIAATVAANYDDIKVDFYGGFGGAERQRALFCHRDFGGRPDWGIAVVRAQWNDEFARPNHRDVLGTLMGLGIERETTGDILLSVGSARVILLDKMADFVCENLTRIANTGVETTVDDLAAVAPREERVKEIRATVASLRIDSIAAAGFGMSRSRAATDIAAEKVQLNWQAVKNAAQSVKEGDVISLRGRGRLEVAEVRGLTKKGRTGVLLRRFL